MFSGKNKYDRSGLQVNPRLSWTATRKRGEIHGRSARDWGRDAQNFPTFYSCAYALVSLVYSTQCRKSVYEDKKLVTARSQRPETPGEEPLLKKTLCLKS